MPWESNEKKKIYHSSDENSQCHTFGCTANSTEPTDSTFIWQHSCVYDAETRGALSSQFSLVEI